jgi:multimeric flavodoxin WrbA
MKILGLSFGRKMKVSEILVKAALMAAEKEGAEVSFVRMLDLDIRPCTGCGGCGTSLDRGGNGRCILKDDLHFLEESFLESDAIIAACPVYAVGPAGLYKDLVDRFGPAHDTCFLGKEQEKRIAAGKTGADLLDARIFKDRFAGLISVGGAMTQNWVALGLPTMHLLTFPGNIKVVDQIDAYDQGRKGSPLLDQDQMDRVARLGRNVASACGKPRDTVDWMGDDGWICPVCHNNLMTLRKTTTVECAVCGIYGTMSIVGGDVKVTFSEAEQKRSRCNYDGKLEHWTEIKSFGGIAGPKIVAAGDSLKLKMKPFEGYRELKFK